MSKWDSLLVKTALSPALIEKCVALMPAGKKAECREALSVSFISAASLKDLRASVREWKPLFPAEIGECVDAELREIVADARWLKTSRGSYVRAVSSLVEAFQPEFRSMPRFLEVFLGAHSPPSRVCNRDCEYTG